MVAILAGLATALISFPVDYYYGYLASRRMESSFIHYLPFY